MYRLITLKYRDKMQPSIQIKEIVRYIMNTKNWKHNCMQDQDLWDKFWTWKSQLSPTFSTTSPDELNLEINRSVQNDWLELIIYCITNISFLLIISINTILVAASSSWLDKIWQDEGQSGRLWTLISLKQKEALLPWCRPEIPHAKHTLPKPTL